MIRIEISNMDQVIAKVLGLIGRMEGAEDEIMDRWTEALDEVCRPACPVDTGYMLSCLHAEKNNDGKITGFWYGIRDEDCDYAKFVEFAWGGRSMWFTPCVESVREEMANIFHEVLMERAGLR